METSGRDSRSKAKMKTRKHTCPYLRNHRSCDYKGNTGDCIYSECFDCDLWQHSQSKAERLILKTITIPSELNHKRSRNGKSN